MIFINLRGLIFGLLIFASLFYTMNDKNVYVVIAISIFCSILDLYFRNKYKGNGIGRFISPITGGFIMFLPIWFLSIIVVLFFSTLVL
jgi:hypothetical protein